MKVKSLISAQLFATLWTAAYQTTPSMRFFQSRGKSPLEWDAIAFSERRPEKTSKTDVFRLSQRLPLKELKTTLVSRVLYLVR